MTKHTDALSLKVMIADDEPKAVRHLEGLIRKLYPSFTILPSASSIEDAREKISLQLPDILFLDIEMPGGSGFDLLRYWENIPFRVIFTTAYEKYAIRAFRFAAADYLLKPVNPDILGESISRVMQLQWEDVSSQLNAVLHTLREKRTDKMALPLPGSLIFIRISEILYMKAEGSYTYVHLISGKKYMVSKNLKHYEVTLESYGFARIHHSYLINLGEVVQYERGEGGRIYLEGGTSLPVSRARKNIFLDVLLGEGQ